VDLLTHTGGCRCGTVRYQASGPASNLCYCHCTSCRRTAGASPVAWGTFARTRFGITAGELAESRSSPAVLRGFCAACGTCLTYRREGRGDEIDVTLASLDEPGRLAPQMHVWVEDKLPWVLIADHLPQYRRGDSSPGG
jgi:hypothetical protein